MAMSAMEPQADGAHAPDRAGIVGTSNRDGRGRFVRGPSSRGGAPRQQLECGQAWVAMVLAEAVRVNDCETAAAGIY
jgi:hypothetical protein